MSAQPTREDVIEAVRAGAIHDFPKRGGLHASGVGVAMRIGKSHATAVACLAQLEREGRVARLVGDDMWRVVGILCGGG